MEVVWELILIRWLPDVLVARGCKLSIRLEGLMWVEGI